MTSTTASAAAEATVPLDHILQRGDAVVGVVGEAALATLPMAAGTFTLRPHIADAEAPRLAGATREPLSFRWCARVSCAVSHRLQRHCVLVKNVAGSVAPAALLDAASAATVWDDLEHNTGLWSGAESSSGTGTLHVYLTSVPDAASERMSTTLNDMPGMSAAAPASRRVTTRVLLGDTPAQVMNAVRQLFDCLVSGDTEDVSGTEVCWPACLPFPVNVHTHIDSKRRGEHAALQLPYEGLLRPQDAIQQWSTWQDLLRHRESTCTAVCRVGEAWERHLATSPHCELAATAAPSLPGAETLVTSGDYDYYHYRVDGFRDDGWGCAYRSLQTILSWFQHAGLLRTAIPSLRRIQEILYQVDPDKADKRAFVGSAEWIGSFEIMLVLQHLVPGLECTIRRLESGKDLDTDSSVQLLLSEHFRSPRAAPVMIGGSSYAHTILGVHVNVHTMEAQYLVLDPHYTANPTQVKTAIKKGFVGWKAAAKFFEAGSWYNLCVPRVDLYDPR
ncbi:Peptidase family C78 [Novymonas esmeraldas]|uniref:Peptidase family C78 n=1 Tax=Novymonas esmeraldas TaxID=1808958 RepID=A0AAW0EWE4_9TRYP